jgi:hypothetical protein
LCAMMIPHLTRPLCICQMCPAGPGADTLTTFGRRRPLMLLRTVQSRQDKTRDKQVHSDKQVRNHSQSMQANHLHKNMALRASTATHQAHPSPARPRCSATCTGWAAKTFLLFLLIQQCMLSIQTSYEVSNAARGPKDPAAACEPCTTQERVHAACCGPDSLQALLIL